SPPTSQVSESDVAASAASATRARPLPSKAPTSQLPGGNETATGCNDESRLGGPGDSVKKTTTNDPSPNRTSNHPRIAGLGPKRCWRLMKIGMLSATVIVKRTSAANVMSPVEADMPRLVGRTKTKKMSIKGIRQLKERMTRTRSQSTTRRGGSAEPHRNRASAADWNVPNGCRHAASVNTP